MAFGLAAFAQQSTVSGTVIDATNGEPLIGASVKLTGTNLGVSTDFDGKFTIGVTPGVSTLTVEYVGYTPQTVPVQQNMTVEMVPQSEMLDAVVVTGYGSGRKLGTVVGSVSVVGSADLANTPSPSFVDALQGKVAGLSILSSSGDPSSVQNQIRLRGVNSLNSSTTPLFILDGAPVTQTVFNTLNPNDIESITVLKDAASVAIYGSRAANGVIVITSRRGKMGDARVNIRAKYGWSQMTDDKTDMMDSKQYVQYRDLIGQPVSKDMRYAAEVLGINTDWRKETFSGHAPTYSIEAGITGGTEQFNYYLSLNHLDQEGIIDQSDMRRETVRVNLNSRVNDWFRVGFQANLGYVKFEQNNESNAIYSGSGVYGGNPMVFCRKALPMDSPYYYTLNEDNKPIWGDKAYYLHFTKMPIPAYFQKYRSVWRDRVTVNSHLFEEITPIEGLTIRAQQAVDAYDYRVKNYGYAHDMLVTPMGDVYTEGANDDGIVEGYNQQSFSRYYQFTYTNTAEYRFKVADVHNISVLLGQESIISKSHGFSAFNDGYSDARFYLLGQGTSVTLDDIGESISQTAMNSFFLSGTYNYKEKYFLDASVRRDGSSYFAPGHRWATFWSAGVMWDAKQEKFLAPVKWLDTAKLRVSYGTTGNSSFANYAYFGLVGSAGLYNGSQAWGLAQPSNYDITWESVAGLDVGLTLGFCDKVLADIAFYNKNTNNMIIQIPYSATTGVTAGWGNVASMRNTGVDVQLSYTPIRTKDWMWELRGNFNYNRNEITALFDGLDQLPFPDSNIIYKVGETANAFYMVRYAGVDPRDGKQMWYTREGNLTKRYNYERDAVIIDRKSQYAPWAGGFGTTVAWKGLSLRADFTWAAEKYMVNNDLYFVQNNNFATSFNQTTKMLDVWTHPGQVTDIPATGQTIQFDTRMLEDASFVRLKTLTLTYSLPKSVTSKARLNDVTLHFTGRNLLTFTGYTGYDPEPETNIIAFFYPNTRQYEFGIDVSF